MATAWVSSAPIARKSSIPTLSIPKLTNPFSATAATIRTNT